MKKQITVLVSLLWIAAGVSACGTGGNAAIGTQATSVLDNSYANALPAEAQLLDGTRKLDGAEEAVGAAPAGAQIQVNVRYTDFLVHRDKDENEYSGVYSSMRPNLPPRERFGAA